MDHDTMPNKQDNLSIWSSIWHEMVYETTFFQSIKLWKGHKNKNKKIKEAAHPKMSLNVMTKQISRFHVSSRKS